MLAASNWYYASVGLNPQIFSTGARPPQVVRWPRVCPLSRLSGATPTRAAICLCDRLPSSGRLAIRVADTTEPTPGTEHNKLWERGDPVLRSVSTTSVHIGLPRRVEYTSV